MPVCEEVPVQKKNEVCEHVKAIIIGAGPSGLATAAWLRRYGVPYIIIERAHCIASLWKNHTYERLHMHTPKSFCELPFMPHPSSTSNFLTRQQFINYLEAYARKFHIEPIFREMVEQATYDHDTESWVVRTRPSHEQSTMIVSVSGQASQVCRQYACKWLVVATGENAEAVLPHLPGLSDFKGTILHSSQYKTGSQFQNKKVLVVGAGNSGMEIALDLANTGSSTTSIVVRSPLHILPREMFGLSTFSLAMRLCKIFPVRFVDCFLVTYSILRFGDTFLYGLRRPKIGPLELKNTMGKTPILDVGTLAKIQSGIIEVKPAIECVTASGVRFVESNVAESYDVLVLATGYKSTVSSWLHDEDNFFNEQGLCKSPAKCWKGKNGLYVAGLSGKGLLRALIDASLIGSDIMKSYTNKMV